MGSRAIPWQYAIVGPFELRWIKGRGVCCCWFVVVGGGGGGC